MDSYWNKVVNGRVSRRRLLALAGMGTASAAFLAACGGGSDDDGGTDSDSGAGGGGEAKTSTGISKGYLKAGTNGAKTGGMMGFIYTDSPNLDILTNALEYAGMSGQYVYDHLISSRSNENAPYVLEAAEALEQPDETTIRFKLRPGMTYHNIAPVNGRAVKASDIVAVQNHVKTLTGAESSFQNTILDKAEAPDDNTVIYKLKAPTAYLFTSRLLGSPWPAGDHSAGDLRQPGDSTAGRQRAVPCSTQWVISNRYHYTRFDKYHGRGKPGTCHTATLTDVLILQDDAPRQAAFRSEQVHYYQPAAGAFKETASAMGSLATPIEWIGLAPYTWNFGMQQGRGPWANPTDIRMRQAGYRLTNSSR